MQSGKILILGGGFGGVRAALDLSKKLGGRAEITLISKNNYHLFVPSLYEVASAKVTKTDPFQVTLRTTVSISYRDIFEGKKITIVQAEMANVDLTGQMVTTKSGSSFSYDYLVLALGSEIADFGIPGVQEYAFHFGSIEDALLVNRTIKKFYDDAICMPVEQRPGPFRIGIGGAGFSGIELAAELALYANNTARSCGMKEKSVVTIFEAMPGILPQATQNQRDSICRRLDHLGAKILLDAQIASIQPQMVKLKNGQEVAVDMMIWTAGIQASRMLRQIDGLPLDPRGKIIVDEYLRVVGTMNVFAVGDNIIFIDHKTQKPIPSLAYLAVDHGAIAAENIMRSIEGGELQAHKPFYDIWVAPVGGKWAVARLWQGITITGFLGWAIRELVDFRYFLSILPPIKAIKLLWLDIKVFSQND